MSKMSSRVKRCLRDIEVTCESRGHTKARDHPENKEVNLGITKVIGVSGFIRGLSGSIKRQGGKILRRSETNRTEGFQRSARGHREHPKSGQAEVSIHPETRTMPLEPFWEKPRDPDPQGSGFQVGLGEPQHLWRGVAGLGFLQGGVGA